MFARQLERCSLCVSVCVCLVKCPCCHINSKPKLAHFITCWAINSESTSSTARGAVSSRHCKLPVQRASYACTHTPLDSLQTSGQIATGFPWRPKTQRLNLPSRDAHRSPNQRITENYLFIFSSWWNRKTTEWLDTWLYLVYTLCLL